MKLRGMDVILWKREIKRPVGVPSAASHLVGVGKYTCFGCDKVFYFKTGDPETPQYASITKKQKKEKHLKYDQAPFCHKCWHRNGLSSPLYRSGCWLCELSTARKAREHGDVRNTKVIEETSTADGTPDLGIEPTTVPWKSSGVRSRTRVPKGRRGSKDKKNRKSR